MEQILEQLYNNFGEVDSRKICPDEKQRIKSRRGNFKRMLKRNQYRQIQRMLDDTDNVACRMSIANFASGVRFGVKFMTEVCALTNDDYEF